MKSSGKRKTCKTNMPRKWIGLAHVRPLPGNDAMEGYVGAYVAVVALAEDANLFANSVARELRKYDFEVLEVEDIEILEERLARFQVDSKVVDVAESLSEANPIGLGTFHAYQK